MIPDAAHRIVYRLGYRVLKLWWVVRRPNHTGALVALWHGDRLLLVRPSYRDGYALPGGGVRRGETPAQAARRELREETGLIVELDDLTPAIESFAANKFVKDTTHVFECRVDAEPKVRIDNREIVEAVFVTSAEANTLTIGLHLRRYLDRVSDGGGAL